jgi:DNA-binding SARP family transcriptional activator
VLALLLLEANVVVPTSRLVTAVWDGCPPTTAMQQVHTAVSSLRRQLTKAGDLVRAIVTEPPGYLARLRPCELDATRFEEKVGLAHAIHSQGDVAGAATELRAALGLWRGTALDGIGGDLISAAAVRLDELRVTVLEDCLDLELDLGAHRRLVPELSALVAAHPLRERLVAHLMVALYRSGRQVEALQTYRDLYDRLMSGYALRPGPELQRLNSLVLRDALPPQPRQKDPLSERCSWAPRP